MNIRENWRVLALVVLLVASSVALFGPPGTVGATEGANENTLTNLRYGIELSGGARIRAPVEGFTAEFDAGDLNPNRTDQIKETVRRELGLDPVDVTVSTGGRAAGQTATDRRRQTGSRTPTVEVFPNQTITRSQFDSQAAFERAENRSDTVSRREFVAALEAAGLDDPNTVRRGVTQATVDEMVQTIEDKINTAGLSGGSVQVAQTAAGERFVIVEAPNKNRQELRELISRRGSVTVQAYFPNDNGSYVNRTVLSQDMAFSTGAPGYNRQNDLYFVPITFSSSAQGRQDAREFMNDMRQYGFAQPSPRARSCPQNFTDAAPPQRCLLTVFNGEVVYSAGVDEGLASDWRTGQWLDSARFVMQTQTREQARNLQIDLQAGRLPADLDFDRGSEFTLEPALAEAFKFNSLITGIIAVIAVSLMVYLRYGELVIAAPMVITALSEVVLLLGFAAAIGYPLDLSVIAGFIAVIGTGVDDLIIIADEVMAEGEVNSSRVFDSRFKKAFRVIGFAAATTIIAMSPLAVLSLGDLQGFAIVTILGVLVGVTITRPAYGDILRTLTTDD